MRRLTICSLSPITPISARCDPKPKSCTNRDWRYCRRLRSSKRPNEEVRHAEQGTQRGADHHGAQAIREGEKVPDIGRKPGVSRPHSTPGRSSMRGWACRSCGNAAVAGGERPAEAAGSGPVARPADPSGDRLKKALKPRQRCRLARWAQEAYQIGERRSARLVRIPWSTMKYKSRKKPQEALRRRLRAIASYECALRISASDCC